MFLYGVVEVENPKNGQSFKINGQCLKPFLEIVVSGDEIIYLWRILLIRFDWALDLMVSFFFVHYVYNFLFVFVLCALCNLGQVW